MKLEWLIKQDRTKTILGLSTILVKYTLALNIISFNIGVNVRIQVTIKGRIPWGPVTIFPLQ
jgi:hypothetical protein